MAKTTATRRQFVRAALATLAALIVGGCAASAAPTPTTRPSGLPTAESFASIPPADSAIVDAWHKAGVSCGEPHVGMPEGRPQWGCQGTLRGVEINAEFMGDDAGMMEMQAGVPMGTRAQTAVGVFDDLMVATPAFPDSMPAVRQWVKGWNGSPGLVSAEMQGVRVSILSDASWITLFVSRDPLSGSPTPGASV